MSNDDLRNSSVYPESSFGEKLEGIPSGRDVEWEPLVDYRRNGVSETPFMVPSHGTAAVKKFILAEETSSVMAAV